MQRGSAKATWQDLSGRIKRRWDRLSEQELIRAEGDREYLVGRIHERYGLGRDEIDRELDLLMAGGQGGARLGSLGYANADNVIPDPGAEAPGVGSVEQDLRIGSEMDGEARRQRDTWTETEGSRQDADPQDVLKDTGSATRSGPAAPLDRPERRQGERRRSSEPRS